MAENSQDAYYVYSILRREGEDDSWLKIGVAYPHSDQQGFEVMLEALPLNDRLVLRKRGKENASGHKSFSLAQQIAAFERAVIERCLVETGGRINAVMERLEIPRRTLNEKMARLGIDRHRIANVARPRNAHKGGDFGRK